ncbi:FAD-dependent oxidoreductase [Streptomyces physcomitrii]|uniref:D-amino-acid oxidase n=1 Tax=Streptomyces physcomitrii TaxID=2724184 RepID=A0ABX1H6P8_9ACTN|nr:FAD-dependent oxidoreductase [Streptomyces physcomitrii]NKI43728.1 FAD-dependent oxidoreductase [Streptomyces physcomitrii]
MKSEAIVIGSGVIGLTTALALAEQGRRVRVWTREPAGATTSAVAGALWWPYRIEPVALAADWALESLSTFLQLAESAPGSGVRTVPGVHRGLSRDSLGSWAARVPGLREATGRECPGGGLWARLPLLDMPVHLRWLAERLAAAGGGVELREVHALDEAFDEAPVVVNCSGLGARELVPDPGVRPVRGQLVLVENPGVESWYVEAAPGARTTTYFFPQPGRLVLGGTAEEDSFSTRPDPGTAAEIVRRCAAVRPEIAEARVLGHLVGLRPARRSVRLEAVRRADGGLLVHHYGHGGAGVTVAWGAARAAAQLVSGVG